MFLFTFRLAVVVQRDSSSSIRKRERELHAIYFHNRRVSYAVVQLLYYPRPNDEKPVKLFAKANEEKKKFRAPFPSC